MYALHARGIVKSKHPNLIKEELTKLKSKLIDKLPSSPLFIESFSRLAYSEEYTKQKKLVQYILAKVCEHYSNGIVIDYDQMTIEHLAPQSPRSVNTISPSDMASIGNLILVEGKLNEKLANKSFKEKKEILLKSNVPLDPIIKNATNRTSHEIQKRAIFLAELGYKTIWRIRK